MLLQKIRSQGNEHTSNSPARRKPRQRKVGNRGEMPPPALRRDSASTAQSTPGASVNSDGSERTGESPTPLITTSPPPGSDSDSDLPQRSPEDDDDDVPVSGKLMLCASWVQARHTLMLSCCFCYKHDSLRRI